MSAIGTFKKIISKSLDTSLLQSSLEEIFRQIQICPLIVGSLVSATTDSSGNAIIPHKLGRQPIGWIVVDNQGSAVYYRTSWSDKFLTVHAVSTANLPAVGYSFSVWVF